jgi:hypothetical protein
MTEHEIASAIENYVTSYEGVTSSSLSLEQIKDEVNTLRMRTVFELDQQKLLMTPFVGYVQTIPELVVIKTTIDEDTVVLTIKVPRVYIRANGKIAITYVGGIDLSSPYRITTGNHHMWSKADAFIGNKPMAHYREDADGGLITLFNKATEKIAVQALWETPSHLSQFDIYDDEVTAYPMPQAQIDMLIGKMTESYIRTMYRIPAQSNIQADSPNQSAQQQGQPGPPTQ